MNIRRLGRASLRVRNLETSARFYCDLLGLPVLSRTDSPSAIELGVGHTHRFALECVNGGGGSAGGEIGLNRIAFVIGNTPRMLEEAARYLSAEGVAYERVAHDEDEYESLLLRDPDGHLIELYYWPEW